MTIILTFFMYKNHFLIIFNEWVPHKTIRKYKKTKVILNFKLFLSKVVFVFVTLQPYHYHVTTL